MSHRRWTEAEDVELWTRRDDDVRVLAACFRRSDQGILARLRDLYRKHNGSDPPRRVRRDVQNRICSNPKCGREFTWRQRRNCVTCSPECEDAVRRTQSNHCSNCGRPKSPEWFGPDRRRTDGLQSICSPCQRELYPYERRGREAIRNEQSRRDRENSELAATATHHRQQWTGPELEIAARADLTLREVAHMLGRTIAAVAYARRGLREDPRKMNLAGLPQPPDN